MVLVAVIVGIAFIGTMMRGGAPTTSPPQRSASAVSKAIAPAPVDTGPVSKWRISSDTSAIDDSKTVHIQVASDNNVRGRFGGPGPAVLHLRCLENTTSATFSFNDQFMADIQGYGDITYRVDDRAAVKRGFQESTDNKWLGLWRGAQAIPFIKSLYGGEKLVARATPFNESQIEVTFSIFGLETAVKPLREACGW